ncbi:MAG: ABC transporter ATP-binding protein [Slackia sp.]|nr:ABC transporter ATP-binding protein [Slackia sp.]
MELSLENLTRRFGDALAVDDVSATLGSGVYGLLGANGAGKTTLMRMVCDVLKPTEGRIVYDGVDIARLGGEYRARLGYLPQDFGYYPDFTAMDFMLYMAALKGMDRRAAKARCADLLEEVGLSHQAKSKVRTFSGGMKQRLGIAQAVLNDPAVLVLDEPTAGLDPKERVRFRNLIAGFSQDKIVLLSTHIVSDVEYIADDILVMKGGRFVLRGAPDAVTESVAGKVWECRVPAREADSLAVSLCVSNVHYAPDGFAVMRIVADEAPVVDAVRVDPTLEDLYLHMFEDGVGFASSDSRFDAAGDGPADARHRGGLFGGRHVKGR